MISGYEESIDQKALARLGVVQILHKPYSIDSLLRVAQQLTQAAASSPPPPPAP